MVERAKSHHIKETFKVVTVKSELGEHKWFHSVSTANWNEPKELPMQEEHISDHKDSRDSRDSRKEEIFTQEQFFALKKEKKKKIRKVVRW